MATLQCQSCGAPVTFAEPIPRDAECESCKRDLRSCRNCRHYDPAYNNMCTEPMADLVEDKLRRNFCEFFYFNRAPFVAGSGGIASDAARAKLEALFGGAKAPSAPKPTAREKLAGPFGDSPATADREAKARRRLDELFKKPTSDDSGGEDEP